MQEKAAGGDSLPYKFTSKELDEETGYYYFGARYYDARLSRWVSADPALDEYLPEAGNNSNLSGLGGIFNSVNMNVYHYAGNNPIILIDPDGRKVYIGGRSSFWGAGGIMYHLSIILKPDNPKDFRGQGDDWDLLPKGGLISTLGAQASLKPGGFFNVTLDKLIGKRNFPSDREVTFKQLVDRPVGISDTDFIKKLIKAANSYNDNLSYDALPTKGSVGYNSNSYVSGILQAAGVQPPILDPEYNTKGAFIAPGYDKPIPLNPLSLNFDINGYSSGNGYNLNLNINSGSNWNFSFGGGYDPSGDYNWKFGFGFGF